MVCIHLMALLRGPGMERSLLVLGQVAMGLHSSSQPQCAKGDGLQGLQNIVIPCWSVMECSAEMKGH